MQNLKYKLNWQCRRGMLELDVILLPFLEQHFDRLDMDAQLQFARLLEAADPDLYTWLMGYGVCDQPELCNIIATIRGTMGLQSSDEA